jgi:hypothetical protein
MKLKVLKASVCETNVTQNCKFSIFNNIDIKVDQKHDKTATTHEKTLTRNIGVYASSVHHIAIIVAIVGLAWKQRS